MKFVSLATARTHRRRKFDKPSSATLESFAKPKGECPTCDSYEARLMELLDTLTRSASSESGAAPHPAFQQGLT